MGQDMIACDWDGLAGQAQRVFGPLYKFSQKFGACQADQSEALVANAFAVGTYIQANASQFAQAGEDMATYFGVYQAGGATAAEFLGACMAVFSIGEWAAILAAVALTAFSVGNQVHCFAVAYGGE